MQRFEFYKSIYDRENSRREYLTNSINIPIGILTAISSAITYFVSSFKNNSLVINVFFYSLTFLCFSFSILSIIFLLKSFNNFHKGHEYKELPAIRIMENYHIQLSDFYKNSKKEIEQKFEEYLILELIEYTDLNIKINDQRSFDLYRAKKFIFFSLIGLVLICIPYVSLNSDSRNNPKNQKLHRTKYHSYILKT